MLHKAIIMWLQLINIYPTPNTHTRVHAQTPEFGTSESFTEAQQNIETLSEDIRQQEVQVTKAEARLAALREAGVDVAKWLQKAGDSQDKLSDLSSVSSLGE